MLISTLLLCALVVLGGAPKPKSKAKCRICEPTETQTTDVVQNSAPPSAPQDNTQTSATQESTPSAAPQETKPDQPSSGESYTGDATYYTLYKNAGAMGSCGTPLPPGNMLVALNPQMNAGNCGKCIEVQKADGTGEKVKVTVWDTCPECSQGSVDLSDVAFEKLQPLSVGRFQVKWRFVPC